MYTAFMAGPPGPSGEAWSVGPGWQAALRLRHDSSHELRLLYRLHFLAECLGAGSAVAKGEALEFQLAGLCPSCDFQQGT